MPWVRRYAQEIDGVDKFVLFEYANIQNWMDRIFAVLVDANDK
jgi:hypothetical protein